MDWFMRGRSDRRDNVPRAAKPNDGENGRHWLQGWDAEDARLKAEDAQETVTEGVPVYLGSTDGKFSLVDAQGRTLGVQSYIAIEQEDDLSVTVRFAQVPIKAE